jgi:hypothetical protein
MHQNINGLSEASLRLPDILVGNVPSSRSGFHGRQAILSDGSFLTPQQGMVCSENDSGIIATNIARIIYRA